MNIDKVDINNFSIDELLDLLDLQKPITRTEIENKVKEKKNMYRNQSTINLLKSAEKILLNYLDNNNLESIFGTSNTLNGIDYNSTQKERTLNTEPVYTTSTVSGKMNPLEKRIQKIVTVVNTKDRTLFTTIECINKKDDGTIEDKFDNTGNLNNPNYQDYISNLTPAEFTKFATGQTLENLKRVLTDKEIYANYKFENPTTIKTVGSIPNKKKLIHKYNSKGELVDDIQCPQCIFTPINNGIVEKKIFGTTNQQIMKDKNITETYNFIKKNNTENTERQYEENASNFLYNFNFKQRNIIKATLADIYIDKNIVNLFVPGVNYYINILEITSDTINNLPPESFPVSIDQYTSLVTHNIVICVKFGFDKLTNIINKINKQLDEKNIEFKFTILSEKNKTYKIEINPDNNIKNTTYKFINNDLCNYKNSLSEKLGLLNKTITFKNDNTIKDEGDYKIELNTELSIQFPEYLYFVFDDMTNNYHNTYYASTRDSTLTSSVLAKIPLKGDKYVLDNTNTDYSIYSREYFGKVNIEKARFQLLSPSGNLINIDQFDFVKNNYYFTLLFDTIYNL